MQADCDGIDDRDDRDNFTEADDCSHNRHCNGTRTPGVLTLLRLAAGVSDSETVTVPVGDAS
ncbi:MAG UNVERIFIED_CONTAM: hypothetical protein LVR18_49020 [Planctomycetaceae bacterium]